MQSQRDRVRHRNWARNRYRNDPEYREKLKARRIAWRRSKIARCPEYRKLGLLRSKVGWLREKIAAALKRIERDEAELIAITSEVARLERECRGK